jgi:hypothetical protein
MKLKPIYLALALALIIAALAPQVRAQNSVPIPNVAIIPSTTTIALNGNGKTELTAAMIHSGVDAAHPNVYENCTVHAGQLNLSNLANVIITKCDIGGFSAGVGINLSMVTNISISGNTFHDLGGGIGAPFTFVGGCNFDWNTFNKVGECIHLDFGDGGQSHDDSVSYNVMQNDSRYAIEIQGNSSGGLKVMHNYCGAISIATQSSPMDAARKNFIPVSQGGTPKSLDQGNEIAYNTILHSLDGPTVGGGALEIYGSGTNIHDNYFSGWGSGVYWDWTGWVPNTPWYVTNNIFVGVGTPVDAGSEGYGPSSGQYADIKPTLINNPTFAANDPKAPPVPTIAQTLATAVVTTQPVAAFTATGAVNGVQLSGLPTTGGTLTASATGNTGAPLATQPTGWPHTVTIPAGQTTYLDQGVPNDWQVAYSFTGVSGFVVTNANAVQVFTTVPTTQPSATLTADAAKVAADEAQATKDVQQLQADVAAGK